jgi:hypothetical protein
MNRDVRLLLGMGPRDELSMLFGALFSGIKDVHAEFRSLPGADGEEIEHFQRELNRLEAEAGRLFVSALMGVEAARLRRGGRTERLVGR